MSDFQDRINYYRSMDLDYFEGPLELVELEELISNISRLTAEVERLKGERNIAQADTVCLQEASDYWKYHAEMYNAKLTKALKVVDAAKGLDAKIEKLLPSIISVTVFANSHGMKWPIGDEWNWESERKALAKSLTEMEVEDADTDG